MMPWAVAVAVAPKVPAAEYCSKHAVILTFQEPCKLLEEQVEIADIPGRILMHVELIPVAVPEAAAEESKYSGIIRAEATVLQEALVLLKAPEGAAITPDTAEVPDQAKPT